LLKVGFGCEIIPVFECKATVSWDSARIGAKSHRRAVGGKEGEEPGWGREEWRVARGEWRVASGEARVARDEGRGTRGEGRLFLGFLGFSVDGMV